jgi:hypothetical protein
MTSWLRMLGLRIALLCVLLPAFAARAAPGPSLPLRLLDAFDQAFALVYDAAERRVAQLEAAPLPAAPKLDVVALLAAAERDINTACDAAAIRLDIELTVAGSLSAERRSAVLGCIEQQLAAARLALDRTTDPAVRAEYAATCDRLRSVRRQVQYA